MYGKKYYRPKKDACKSLWYKMLQASFFECCHTVASKSKATLVRRSIDGKVTETLL